METVTENNARARLTTSSLVFWSFFNRRLFGMGRGKEVPFAFNYSNDFSFWCSHPGHKTDTLKRYSNIKKLNVNNASIKLNI